MLTDMELIMLPMRWAKMGRAEPITTEQIVPIMIKTLSVLLANLNSPQKVISFTPLSSI